MSREHVRAIELARRIIAENEGRPLALISLAADEFCVTADIAETLNDSPFSRHVREHAADEVLRMLARTIVFMQEEGQWPEKGQWTGRDYSEATRMAREGCFQYIDADVVVISVSELEKLGGKLP